MTFDGSINLGHIFSTMIFLITGFYFVWGIQTKLMLLIQQTNSRHESNTKELVEIKHQLNELSKTTIELAKQEMRMNNIDQRILELSNRIHSRLVSDKDNPKRRSFKS